MKPDRTQFRDGSRYLAAVASEIASPILRAYAGLRARGPATRPSEWRRGLIIGSGHIGDVLYRTCSLNALASGLPDCEWTYLTTPDGAELLRGNPALANVLAFNRETATDFAAPHSADDLRAMEFDAILCTDNIAHHHGLFLATRLGIPNRVAFAGKGFSGLATLPVRTPRAPWPEQIRTMVAAVTDQVDAAPLRPCVYLSDVDREKARTAWESLRCGDSSLTIVAAVTTRQRRGEVPRGFFASLLLRLLDQEPRARIILTGTVRDAAELNAMASALGGRAAVCAGSLGLREFAAFTAMCDAFLGADSGPRHIANAGGIPVFFVRNLAAPEIETGRYCPTETDIAPPGQYLSGSGIARLLDTIDCDAAAHGLRNAALNYHEGASRRVTA